MALRAVHSSGSYGADITVDGVNLGAADTVHTTIVAAQAASSDGDTIVLVQDAEHDERINTSGTAYTLTADDAVRHDGTWGGARIKHSRSTSNILIRHDSVTIRNVAMWFIGTSGNALLMDIRGGTGTVHHVLSGCFIKLDMPVATKGRGIYISAPGGGGGDLSTTIESCHIIAVGNSKYGIRIQDITTVELLNNTIMQDASEAGNIYGIIDFDGTSTVECVNNVVFEGPNLVGTLTAYDGCSAHSSYSAGYNADDGDGTAPGTTTYTVDNSDFLDPDNEDIHWKDSATMASYTGSNVSSDMVYDFDIDGDPRLLFGTWYIGADVAIEEINPDTGKPYYSKYSHPYYRRRM